MRGIAALRRFVDAGAGAAHACDGCGAVLADDHDHVVAPHGSKHGDVACACAACFVGVARVGKRVDVVNEDAGAVFAALGVPVDLATIVDDSKRGRLLRYPSPAGVVEGPLRAVVDVSLAKDTEALLFVRKDNRVVLLRVPIDVAHAVTGLLRQGWSGLHGDRARADVAAYIDRLLERACR